jgi:hypothetical protein
MSMSPGPTANATALSEMLGIALLEGARNLVALREALAALNEGDYATVRLILNNSAAAQAGAYDSIETLLYRALPRSGERASGFG